MSSFSKWDWFASTPIAVSRTDVPDLLTEVSGLYKNEYITKLIAQKCGSTEIDVKYTKPAIDGSMLSDKASFAYNEILRYCNTDKKLLSILDLIANGPTSMKISGRIIDTLVTRFSRYENVCYYLDVTDPVNSEIVTEASIEGRNIILFDVSASYRKQMQIYSKMYFDCFSRGIRVKHTLGDGSIRTFSICKVNFFIWASRFKVFDFLEKRIDKIIEVRRRSQKQVYKPKRKKYRTNRVRVDLNKIETILVPPHRAKRIRIDTVHVIRTCWVYENTKVKGSRDLHSYLKKKFN
jgi:hypothetical protein